MSKHQVTPEGAPQQTKENAPLTHAGYWSRELTEVAYRDTPVTASLLSISTQHGSDSGKLFLWSSPHNLQAVPPEESSLPGNGLLLFVTLGLMTHATF